MKKHMRVNWTRWHEKCTWNLSHWVIHNWPSSKICKLFTPYLQVIQLMFKKKRQKKQQCLRSLRSLFAFGPKKHQRSKARGHKGHRSTWITALSSIWRGDGWKWWMTRSNLDFYSFYRDPIWAIGMMWLAEVAGPFWVFLWWCRP